MRKYAVVFLLLACVGWMPGQQPPVTIDKDSRMVVELDHALDVKKLKAGDTFTARLCDHVKSNGKIIVPYTKGKIVGHVAQVQAPTKDDNLSRLVLAFDKITIKGGGELPVTGVIVRLELHHNFLLSNSSSSVPTSGDNPIARAAGPRTDSNGNPVVAPHGPISQPGPVPLDSGRQFSGMEGVELAQNSVAQTSEFTSSDKKGLRIGEWTRFTLRLNSPQ
jgi:hypothetical protein